MTGDQLHDAPTVSLSLPTWERGAAARRGAREARRAVWRRRARRASWFVLGMLYVAVGLLAAWAAWHLVTFTLELSRYLAVTRG